MFPIPFNFPFRKANGDISTIGAEINAGGGGSSYILPTASAETKGGIKIGAGLSMDGEVLNNSNPTAYTLPTASAETLGGVKVGTGLSIDDGVLSASGGGSSISYTTLVPTRNHGPIVGSGITLSKDAMVTFTGDSTISNTVVVSIKRDNSTKSLYLGPQEAVTLILKKNDNIKTDSGNVNVYIANFE